MDEVISNGRRIYVDIAKGILILGVVVGHSLAPFASMIFWFHMPAFFIISGMVFKKKKNMHDYAVWAKKSIRRNIIPYVAYYFTTSVLLMIAARNFNIIGFLKQSRYFIYGGRAIGGVYWFITCLLLTEIFFGYMLIKFNKSKILIIILVGYLLAHIE